MNRQELTEKIRSYLEQNFPRGIKIEDETSLMNSGIIDSMGIIEIIEFLESNFDIVVDDEEVDQMNFDSIVNMVRYVETKLSCEKVPG